MTRTHLNNEASMNESMNGTRHRLLSLLTVMATLGCHTAATSQSAGQIPAPLEPTERFDLVLYGSDFDPDEHEVFIRTNLDFGSDWVSLGTIAPAANGGDPAWGAVVFTDNETARFLGQDFRESYLELRITTRDGSDGSRLSAVYVMPHVAQAADAQPHIARLIEEDPRLVEQHSLASHVQPTPHPLRPGPDYVQHVRIPMKHALPGVMEVQQLQVEWRNRGQ